MATDKVQLDLDCGCGASLSINEVSMAQVEMTMELWEASHPHSPEAQILSASKTYGESHSGLGIDEDDDRDG